MDSGVKMRPLGSATLAAILILYRIRLRGLGRADGGKFE